MCHIRARQTWFLYPDTSDNIVKRNNAFVLSANRSGELWRYVNQYVEWLLTS